MVRYEPDNNLASLNRKGTAWPCLFLRLYIILAAVFSFALMIADFIG